MFLFIIIWCKETQNWKKKNRIFSPVTSWARVLQYQQTNVTYIGVQQPAVAHQFHYPILLRFTVCGLVWWYPCVGSMTTSRITADYLHCTNRCIPVTLGGGTEFFKIFDLALAWFKVMHCLRKPSHVYHVLTCYVRVIDACLYCTLTPSDVTVVNVDRPTIQSYLQRT